MSKDITIVTAFFDLGRGEWTPEGDFNDGFQRSTDVYLERFSILASLENELVVYTSPELAPEVWARRRGKEAITRVIPLPFFDMFEDRRETIRRIQQSPVFTERINPAQQKNPERRSADYILLTNLKPFFVLHAVQNGLTTHDQVA
jgi:protein YibB